MNKLISSLLCLFVALVPSWVRAQVDKDHFSAILTIENIDFGEWSGVDLQGSFIPETFDNFCIIYVDSKTNTAFQVDYDLQMNDSQTETYLSVTDGVESLPVYFEAQPASGSIVDLNGGAGAVALTKGAIFPVTFPNPATSNNHIKDQVDDNGVSVLAPNGCNDAKMDFTASIRTSDIIALASPIGVYSGSFSLRVIPGFDSGNVKVDDIDFTVSISITTGVYLTQLASTIDLGVSTSTDFCVWTFGGEPVTLSVTGSEGPAAGRSFSMAQYAMDASVVDTIGYDISIDDLVGAKNESDIISGQSYTGWPTVDVENANCTGGLNYRLNFSPEDTSIKKAGSYSDTITITATIE